MKLMDHVDKRNYMCLWFKKIVRWLRLLNCQGGIFLRNLGTRFPGNFFTDRKFWMKSHAFQKKYWSEFTHIWKESWVRNKIGLLWCHNHNELRLIEVEVNLSGISLTSYRGQFDTFLFYDIFLLYEVNWRPLEPYQAIFGSGWGLRSILVFTH